VPKLPRKAGPIGLAMTAYDMWRRLSPRQKKLIAKQAKKYGPQIAARAMRSAQAAKASLRKR
jgi:hypothetical protein